MAAGPKGQKTANGRVMDKHQKDPTKYFRKRAAEARAKAKGMAADDDRKIVFGNR
jgi:hypothetical protein